ncbi:hypothetical protein [Kutzneria albida]|uniref:Uncharacterized protein n=1 Tax=Kutzneria albida DSM 43870 TaxID=1449976 RepID=W5WC59_9PSEU|nr:hypothetical protein [Kutzneria albida]AHH98345.1 hypothetical protein KALB_4983 [Kutzneria albida DSM 43870]
MIVLKSGVIVRSGRNPFEVFLLSAAVLSGGAGLLAQASWSPAVANTLPDGLVPVWYGGLVLGGVVSVVGVLLNGLVSLLVERVGLTLLGGFAVLYVSVVLVEAGWRGTLPALFVGAFAMACVGRFVTIGRDLKRAAAAEPRSR